MFTNSILRTSSRMLIQAIHAESGTSIRGTSASQRESVNVRFTKQAMFRRLLLGLSRLCHNQRISLSTALAGDVFEPQNIASALPGTPLFPARHLPGQITLAMRRLSSPHSLQHHHSRALGQATSSKPLPRRSWFSIPRPAARKP